MADLPIKELGDQAPEYERPFVSAAKPAVDRRRRRRAADGPRRRAGEADRHARPVLEALGLGAIRPHHPGQHGAAPGRRRRRGARRERPEGPRAHHRRDAALLRGRSVRGRQAGGGRMLAQSDRGRRRAARRHRQSQFRQSGAARDHGPIRRLHPRHRGSLQGARLPGRLRQRLALQRDQRQGDPADALDRRRRPARRFHQVAHRLPSSARAKRSCWSARPPAGSASRSICARFAGGRRARRRRSI